MGASLLSRIPSSPRTLSETTPLQSQVDQLVGGFVQQASDWRSLAAMTAGGVAYRVGRIGAMGLRIGTYGPTPFQMASIGFGLTAEVSAFELSHRTLQSEGANPNLWRWTGPGGLRQGLFQSFITFGALKSVGRIAQRQNVVVQHLLQDTAMVLGHHASAAFEITPAPLGSLAEQFLHAEATNLQIGAGMALAHRFAPGLQALERGLDLSLRTQIPPAPLFQRGAMSDSPLWQRGVRGDFAPAGERPPIFWMAAAEEPGGNAIREERSASVQKMRDRIQVSDPLQPNEITAMLLEISNNASIPVSDRYEVLMEIAFHPGFKEFDAVFKALEKLNRQGSLSARLEPLFEKASRDSLLDASSPPAGMNARSVDEAFRRSPLVFAAIFRLLLQTEEDPAMKAPEGNAFPEFSSAEEANAALLAMSLGALASHPELKEPRHFDKLLGMLHRSGADPESIGYALREIIRHPHLSDDLSFRRILEILPLTLMESGAASFHTQDVLDKLLEHPHFNAAELLDHYLTAVKETTDSPHLRACTYSLISKHPRFQGSESYHILLAAIFREKANPNNTLLAAAVAFEQPTYREISMALEIIQRSQAQSPAKLSALRSLADNPSVRGDDLLKIVEDIRGEPVPPAMKVEVLKHILRNRWIYDHAILEEMAEEFLTYLVQPRKTLPTLSGLTEELEVVAGPLERIAANGALPPPSFEQIKNIISRLTYLTSIDRKSLILRLQWAFDKARKYLH